MALPEGKAFDMDTMTIVDKPAEKTEAAATTTETEKTEESSEEKKEDDIKEDVVDEKKVDDTSDEKKEEEVKEEEKDKPSVEDDSISVNDYLAERYGEYDIKSEEDLDAVIASYKELTAENERLKNEVKEAKPKFSNEQEEKAYEFIKSFDVSKMNDGARTFANLIFLDVEKSEPRVLLEEKFIFDHPELTRDEALRKFNKEYNRKYVVDKADFDDEAKFKEEEEDRRIDMKSDVEKAKKYLANKQKEFKAKSKEEAENISAPKENAAIQRSIKANVSELDGFVKDLSELVFSPSDNDKDNFSYKLSKEQISQVQASCKAWIGNPASYNEKGELIGAEETGEMIKKVAYHLFGDDLMEKAYKAGLSLGEAKRADQIASTQPDRQAKVADGKVVPVREEDQVAELVKKKKAERASRPLIPTHG